MSENTLTDAGTGAAAEAVRETIAVQSQDATPVQVAKEETVATEGAAEADAAAAAAAAAAEAAKPDQGEAGKKRPEPVPEWMQKRFDAIAYEKREAERKAKALEAELAALKAGKPNAEDAATARADGPDPNAANAGYRTKAEFDAAVAAEAQRREAQQRQQAEEETFNMACNTAYAAGSQAYPDFDQAIKNLGQAGAMQRDLLDMILAADDPSKVLYDLGSDPSRAQQILALPPAKRAIELAKMAIATPAPKAPAPITKAPPPMTPVEGSARASSEPRDDDPDDAWFAKRNAQLAARQGR